MLTEEELKKILPKVSIDLKDIESFPEDAAICTNMAFDKATMKGFSLDGEEVRQVVDSQFEKYQDVALQLLKLLMSGIQVPGADTSIEKVRNILDQLSETKKAYLSELVEKSSEVRLL